MTILWMILGAILGFVGTCLFYILILKISGFFSVANKTKQLEKMQENIRRFMR